MRYYFSLEAETCLNDDDGEILFDDDAAVTIARAIANELGRNNPRSKEWAVIARDESGRVVATIRC
jgi:hypothetical protein